MYVYKDEATALLRESADSMVATIERHRDKLFDLVNETDWALVIKLHATLEATVTQLVVAYTADELKPVVERLPLSDAQVGKAKMGVDLGVIEPSMYIFIRRFSELRNDLVHDTANMDLDLKAYVDSLDQNQRKRWKKALVWTEGDEGKRAELESAMLTNPRTTLYIMAFTLILILATTAEEPKAKRQIQELAEKTTRQLLCPD
ncbi:TPA: hypothetical protein NH571_001271 [Pseudomonas aeruginosa]|nr:hypothetical protein [Pseudomonas aeruginosa]